MENTISAEEIQQLRENAEKERRLHRTIMHQISTFGSRLNKAQQLEIVHHRCESEILALLKCNGVLAEETQLFIYDDKNNLPKAKDYMLKNTTLNLAIQKKFFDDDLQLFWEEDDNICYPPHFSPAGEKYMVDQVVAKCEKCTRITTELGFLNIYVRKYKLSPEAERSLMNFLSIQSGLDSTLDKLEHFVMDYIARYRGLADMAILALIASGNHRVIMYYLKYGSIDLMGQEVRNALEKRANRDEVVVYYKRYASEE